MLKLSGIAIFSVCVSLIGFFMSANADVNTRTRREFIALIYAIRNGIQYGKSTLREIYLAFPAKELKKCGFYDVLINNSQPDFKNALNSSNTGLSESETELLYAFASECGKSTFAEEEIRNCDRYISLLEELDKQLFEKENTKKLIYSKLGILAGILSCILLL